MRTTQDDPYTGHLASPRAWWQREHVHLDLHQQCVGVLEDLLLLRVQQDLSEQMGDDLFGRAVLAGDEVTQKMQGSLQEVLLHGGAYHAHLTAGDELGFLLCARQRATGESQLPMVQRNLAVI